MHVDAQRARLVRFLTLSLGTAGVGRSLDINVPTTDEIALATWNRHAIGPRAGDDVVSDVMADVTGRHPCRPFQGAGTGHRGDLGYPRRFRNASVDELAGILGIPDGITTIVTFPVAYTKGTEFKPAVRRRAEQISYFDRWGFTKSRVSTDGGTAFDDGLAVVAEVDIDASPRRVWPSNTDITRPVGAGVPRCRVAQR